MHYDVAIIGAGILGCVSALEILTRNPTLKIVILEKEHQIAKHQTGHNSGVIHAGVYYKPGSLKAKFCRTGCQATKEFCDEHQIPYKVLGKMIVATNENEMKRMDALKKCCEQNQLSVTSLNDVEANKLQPGLRARSALFIEESGIVDWRRVCNKYALLAKARGAEILCRHPVIEIKESNAHVTLKTPHRRFDVGHVIVCAGLYSDKLVRLSGHTSALRIIPFRGEYYRLSERYNHYFKHLIYPVPDPRLPFLGVHFSPTMSGYSIVGPNAVLALAREGYQWRSIDCKEAWETLTFMPLWKMLRQYPGAMCREILGSVSKAYYLRLLQKYFPDITANDLKSHWAGVRAQAIDVNGKLVEDFIFSESDRILHVCNAPSPAATSSLPIAWHIADRFFDKTRARNDGEMSIAP